MAQLFSRGASTPAFQSVGSCLISMRCQSTVTWLSCLWFQRLIGTPYYVICSLAGVLGGLSYRSTASATFVSDCVKSLPLLHGRLLSLCFTFRSIPWYITVLQCWVLGFIWTVLFGLDYFSEILRFSSATVTPDRTIYWSYDWLLFGERATDRQCLLRSPEAVAYCDRSFLLVVGHRTIGRTRGRAINNDWRRSMAISIISLKIVRLVVAKNDRSYDQSWPPTIDRMINRGILPPKHLHIL